MIRPFNHRFGRFFRMLLAKKINSSQSYIPEIDGLRALAVLSVMFSHFGLVGFSGGYIGVDIFFAISGFLITRIIATEIDSKTWGFANFYLRRGRRILPALIFTLVLTFFVGALIYPPSLLKDLGLSVLYSIFSLSNFYFWTEGGYFSQESYLKPLLHTWSLSVEEQFYIIWPIALLFASFFSKKIFVIVSLVVSTLLVVLTESWISKDPDAAYFLTHFRAVEFLIGGACVLFYIPTISRWLKEVITFVGLVLCLLPIFLFSKNTIFPGLNALVPCFGVALVILGSGSKCLGWILRTSVSRYVGKISYSLYLVHWPVYCFYYYLGGGKQLSDVFVLSVLSFTLATFSYHFIEKPFRSEKFELYKLARGAQLVVYLGILSIVIMPILHSVLNDGWPWRQSKEVVYADKLLNKMHAGRLEYISSSNCHIFPKDLWGAAIKESECFDVSANSYNAIVFGSSYAADMASSLRIAYSDVSFGQLTVDGCRLRSPIAGAPKDLDDKQQRCKTFFDLIIKNKRKICDFDMIIVHDNYVGRDYDNPRFIEKSNIRFKSSALKFVSYFDECDTSVVIIGPRQKIMETSNQAIKMAVQSSNPNAIIEDLVADFTLITDNFRTLSEERGNNYVDLYRLGYTKNFYNRNGFFYTRRNHWSPLGIEFVAQAIAKNYPDIRDMKTL